MTVEQIALPGGALHRDPVPPPGPVEGEREVATTSLPEALRAAAHRRRIRADALRAWSSEVRPLLGRSLRRRASELELAAVALELRADGMDGGVLPAPDDEEQP